MFHKSSSNFLFVVKHVSRCSPNSYSPSLHFHCLLTAQSISLTHSSLCITLSPTTLSQSLSTSLTSRHSIWTFFLSFPLSHSLSQRTHTHSLSLLHHSFPATLSQQAFPITLSPHLSLAPLFLFLLYLLFLFLLSAPFKHYFFHFLSIPLSTMNAFRAIYTSSPCRSSFTSISSISLYCIFSSDFVKATILEHRSLCICIAHTDRFSSVCSDNYW